MQGGVGGLQGGGVQGQQAQIVVTSVINSLLGGPLLSMPLYLQLGAAPRMAMQTWRLCGCC